jgi:hypothetical protein
MSANDTYLAVFLGSKSSPRRVAWDALAPDARRIKEREGMTAWRAWADKHSSITVAHWGLAEAALHERCFSALRK